MNDNSKHANFGFLGLGAIGLGSLMIALATDGSGDSTGLVFLGVTGLGLHISGIGLVISAGATYLRKSD